MAWLCRVVRTPGTARPSAVIDKSLLHTLCVEPQVVQTQVWGEISRRYQIVIPFVLLEEVLTNIVCPGRKKPAVVGEMKMALFSVRELWIDDEISIAYQELVLKHPVTILPQPPKGFMDSLYEMDMRNPHLIEFVRDRQRIKELLLRERMAEQEKALAFGTFCYVGSENEFFNKYIRQKFTDILNSPERTKALLEKVLGHHFRERFPKSQGEIDAAFQSYTADNFINYPITLHCIMAAMFYFYAPLFRIGKKGDPRARKLIGRGRSAQRNNPEDEKYVATALNCSRLLTRDEGMNNIMNAFKAIGFWKGEVVYLNPRDSFASQVPSRLI